jgi:predicted MFS family arabinose efflux permease
VRRELRITRRARLASARRGPHVTPGGSERPTAPKGNSSSLRFDPYLVDNGPEPSLGEVRLFLLAIVALGLVAVPIFRGRLAALAEVRLRGVWLLLAAMAIQLLVFTIAPGPRTTARSVAYVGSYALAMAFVILNRRVPGLWVIWIGAGMNLLVIAANGGVMPAAEQALIAADMPVSAPRFFSNSVALPDPKLPFLGDIFAIPSSWPLSNVFSAGDVCIAVGAVVMIHRLTGSRLTPSGAGQLAQALRHRSFARLLGAQAVSNLGDWVYALAVAATLSQRMDGPDLVRTLSILLVCQAAPAALFGALFAGPLADRRSRRNLMIVADAMRALAISTLLLSSQPSPAHFYLVAVCLGLFGAVFQPSLMASIPNVVGKGEVVAANALVGAIYHAAIMIGPALGAFLISTLDPRPVFGLNATSFAISAVLIFGVRMPAREQHRRGTSPVRDLIEGGRYVLRTPLVRGVLLVMSVVLLAAATKTPLETLFVRDVLTKGGDFAERARVLAFVTTAWGLGMLLGSLASPALARRWPRERLLPASIAMVGLTVLAVSTTSDFRTVLLAWLIAGTANSVGNVSYESLLQERTPDELRGRVFAAAEAALDGSYLAGVFLAGFLGSLFAVSGAFAISGGILLFAAVLARFILPGARRGAPMTSRQELDAPKDEWPPSALGRRDGLESGTATNRGR